MIFGENNKDGVTVCISNPYAEALEHVTVDNVKEFYVEGNVLHLMDGKEDTVALFNMSNVVYVY